MAKYVVIHGSFIAGKTVTGIGGSIELTDEERAHLDPLNEKLAAPEAFGAMQQVKQATAVIEAAKAPAPKTVKPEPAPKKDGGK